MAKRKITGFARFILALIIIVPGAYIGASYMNGEDGIENVKRLIGLSSSENKETSNSTESSNPSTDTCELQLNSIKKQVKNLRKENENLRAEVESLKVNR